MKAHAFGYDGVHLNLHAVVAERGEFMRAIIERQLRLFAPLFLILVFAVFVARAQEKTSQPPGEDRAALGAKIEVLTHSIELMQSELEQSRAEIQQLRTLTTPNLRNQSDSPPANAADEHAQLSQQ